MAMYGRQGRSCPTCTQHLSLLLLLLFSSCCAFSQLSVTSQRRRFRSDPAAIFDVNKQQQQRGGWDTKAAPLFTMQDGTEQALPQPSRQIAPFVYKMNASTKWLVTIANSVAVWARPSNFQGPFIVLGSILAVYFTVALKKLINQGRPDGSPFADPGMPSSHSLVSFFSVACWVSVLPASLKSLEVSLLLWASASAVALLRVICGYHSYAQIGVGATLGSFLGWAWITGGTAMNVANPRLTFMVSWITYLIGATVYISKDIPRWLGKDKHL
jgi:hypothetical protein